MLAVPTLGACSTQSPDIASTADTEMTAPPSDEGIAPPSNDIKAFDEMFVYGVDDGDVLNMRSGPSPDYAIVATLEPDQRGIEASMITGTSGASSAWRLVSAEGASGWANTRFLRPVPSVAQPAILGDPSSNLRRAANEVVERLSDPSSLADLLSENGLLYRDSCNDITLADDASNTTPLNKEVRIEGANGDCQEVTFTTASLLLTELQGRVSLTSTEQISFGEQISPRTKLDTATRDQFGDSIVVVYHYGGGNCCDGLDWDSTGLVFENIDNDYRLRAVFVDNQSP